MNTTSKEKIIEIARHLIKKDPEDRLDDILSCHAKFKEQEDLWLVIFEVDHAFDPSTIFVYVNDKTHEAKIFPTV